MFQYKVGYAEKVLRQRALNKSRNEKNKGLFGQIQDMRKGEVFTSELRSTGISERQTAEELEMQRSVGESSTSTDGKANKVKNKIFGKKMQPNQW